MSLGAVIFAGGLVLLVAYFSYGRFLSRVFELDDHSATPACRINDGKDFVPAPGGYLLGQHFSAIAAAGPIVGPILAGMLFGWLPAFLWIVLGSIFVGGVHDFSSLVVSVRHQARSVAEVLRQHMSRRAHLLFLGFVWLSLVYVIIAFTDVTAQTFVSGEEGKGVASASMLYLLVALLLGLFLRATRMDENRASLLFLPLVFAAIWLGDRFPLSLPGGPDAAVLTWDYLLLLYCFAASLAPMWALLQPRGSLGGYFLYATLIAAVLGLLFGGYKVNYPAFKGAAWDSARPLLPFLFVTVACGACSGFHAIVSSGTTSRQLSRESDARLVGYGGMLLEGFVALSALSTLMLLAPDSPEASKSPSAIYAAGMGGFLEAVFGLPRDKAVAFGLLAFATFVYDTLDVCTRLGRYIFQELSGLQGRSGAVLATLATLALPAYCVSLQVRDAAGQLVPVWKVFWTLFGASNQLLAALTLLGVSVWMKATRRPVWITALPMALMMVMTLWALKDIAAPFFRSLRDATVRATPAEGLTALVLMALALLVLAEAARILFKPAPAR